MTLPHFSKIALKNLIFGVLATSFCLALSGCTSIVSNAGYRVGTNLSSAILNNNDLATVRDGAPAYLIILDSLIQADPENPRLLLSTAQITNAYATAFVSDPARNRLMADKSFKFAQQAACLHQAGFCQLKSSNINKFKRTIKHATKDDIDFLYTLGSAWASWIQTHSDDWNSITEIVRVQLIMEKVISLDDRHDNGGAHLYLGTLATLLPP
ncbi:MAG TPA: TRAP transporter TatT component family protein, partial [Pseudomonadales bacterium]|nr:TRAP transporter TatT component family protein [Pseudomonadales bacterium]